MRHWTARIASWISWTPGHAVVKALVGLTAFVGSVIGILAALHVAPFDASQSAVAAARDKLIAAGSSRVYMEINGPGTSAVGAGEAPFSPGLQTEKPSSADSRTSFRIKARFYLSWDRVP